MIRVILESPFAGATPEDEAANIAYAQRAMHDCLMRGESPFASHLLYTQPNILDDAIPAERDLGIAAGFVWREACERTVVYIDRGISRGMRYGIEHAESIGQEVVFRNLEGKS